MKKMVLGILLATAFSIGAQAADAEAVVVRERQFRNLVEACLQNVGDSVFAQIQKTYGDVIALPKGEVRSGHVRIVHSYGTDEIKLEFYGFIGDHNHDIGLDSPYAEESFHYNITGGKLNLRFGKNGSALLTSAED